MYSSPYCLYCFDTVGRVINPEIDRIAAEQGRTRKDIESEVERHRIAISSQYWSGQKPQIEFDDPLCRLGYLYGSTALNAILVEAVFSSDTELQEWFNKLHQQQGRVRVCTLGGGPGTEILGIAKWAERQRLNGRVILEALVTDQFDEWAEDCQKLCGQIQHRLLTHYRAVSEKLPVSVESRFIQADLDDADSFQSWDLIGDHDIYMLTYVMSHVFNNYSNVRRFISILSASLPKGTKFLFIDRAPNSDMFKSPVRLIARSAGIELSEFQSHESRDPGDPLEQVTDLGKIHANVGSSLRLGLNAFWVVGTKV